MLEVITGETKCDGFAVLCTRCDRNRRMSAAVAVEKWGMLGAGIPPEIVMDEVAPETIHQVALEGQSTFH